MIDFLDLAKNSWFPDQKHFSTPPEFPDGNERVDKLFFCGHDYSTSAQIQNDRISTDQVRRKVFRRRAAFPDNIFTF